MRPRDIPAVARIERAVFRGEAWPRSAFAHTAKVFAAAQPPRGRLWVAEAADGRLLGYAGIELSTLGGEADVINIAIHPAHRRCGVGRRLIRMVATYCRRRGTTLLWLRVRASNRGARAFYRRVGFETVGRFRGYYDHPREDAVLMALARSRHPLWRSRRR
jgi:ribosomal-protein-alanine N-acetyltransferase